MKSFVISMLLWAAAVSQAFSHEYYLLPDDFAPAVGSQVAVRHKLGQRFNGNELPWVSVWNIRSELWAGKKVDDLRSKDGDRPALKLTAEKPQLHVVLHESNIDSLKFTTWEKFEKYATKSGLGFILDRHRAEGRPMPTETAPIKEIYARFAKTLITPDGAVTGADIPTGLTIELIAKKNPLTLLSGEPMPVQLLFQGRPLSGATVAVFNRVDSEVAHNIVTDQMGMAEIPDDGPGPYLLNAIHMTDVQATSSVAKDADWQSFWASLTYKRGG